MEELKDCKYCNDNVNTIYDDWITCKKCENCIHVKCLKRQSTPGGIYGDVFFNFSCVECSGNENEIFVRQKITWFSVIILALYHLQHKTPGTAQNGFLHWRTHLVTFIDRKWDVLFPKDFKRKKNWMGTISGSLSHFSPCFLTSGSKELGESGWWSLTFPKLTPSFTVRLYNMMVSDKKANIKELDDLTYIRNLVQRYAPDALQSEIQPIVKKESIFHQLFEADDIDVVNDEIDSFFPELNQNDTNLFKHDFINQFLDPVFSIKKEKKIKKPLKTLFQPSKNTDFYQFLRKCNSTRMDQSNSNIHPIRTVEENTLLTYLDDHLADRQSRALKRKLVVRALKRKHNLPLFNVNTLIKSNGHVNLNLKDRFCHYAYHGPERSAAKEIRLASGRIDLNNYLVSPYTNRLLKPYIRRDTCPASFWLRFTLELMKRFDYVTPLDISTLDFCYVRPNHIPAINAMCEQYFWPGIDLAEALEYPDFSCVVLYKKLVVAFAFMVPDVKFNETYISFIFSRPEWRNCGIGTFMIYHLIQTCMGKDVTLHVAIDNPAIFLYQKFGFKVEEVVLNFYDTYLRDDSKQCKHAFFLRLER